MPSKRPLLPKRGSLNTTKLDLRCNPGAVADPRLVASVLEIQSGGVFVRWRRVFSRLLSPWSLWSESEVYLRVERGVLLFVLPALGFWCLHAVCSAQGRRQVRLSVGRCLVAPVGSVGGVDGGVSWLGNGHRSAWSAPWLAQQIIPFLLAGSEDLVSDFSPSQPVISELFLDGTYLKYMFIGYANFYQAQDLVFTAVHLFAASDLFRL
ncbi:unnamed protein product [Brassica rapa]|uniref:Uncharacterized protein n=1 Tax=Brassica campestris TaxID=3711 RepID=A0A8D9HXN4_BRACM|nr:unnamed protein product [Brassica rapa]